MSGVEPIVVDALRDQAQAVRLEDLAGTLIGGIFDRDPITRLEENA